jgi:DNA replication protein DnaC
MLTHQLERQLKKLRLSGMTQTLDVRLQQAQADNIGYLAFLEILLEDELQRQSNRAISRRIDLARFDESKTLAEFDFHFNPKVPATLIRDLSTCGYIEKHESVIICGPVGVGKSHIAQALGRKACEQGYRVLYRKAHRFFADLGGGRADGTWEKRFRRYMLLDLLILDDFGMRELSAFQAEDFYELVSGFYKHKSMMVVSNRSPQDWYKLFPNPVLAEGALDRLINSSHIVLMTGPTYRTRQRPGAVHNEPEHKSQIDQETSDDDNSNPKELVGLGCHPVDSAG